MGKMKYNMINIVFNRQIFFIYTACRLYFIDDYIFLYLLVTHLL